MLAALVDVRTSATVPAEHNATFRAFNLGILMHSESGMFAAAFILIASCVCHVFYFHFNSLLSGFRRYALILNYNFLFIRGVQDSTNPVFKPRKGDHIKRPILLFYGIH
jgi:hypothetical protein